MAFVDRGNTTHAHVVRVVICKGFARAQFPSAFDHNSQQKKYTKKSLEKKRTCKEKKKPGERVSYVHTAISALRGGP